MDAREGLEKLVGENEEECRHMKERERCHSDYLILRFPLFAIK